VVDDEEVVRRVIRETLEKPGTFIVEAEDGETAIALLLSEPFNLIICDKNLPGITGLDVIRRAKAKDPKIATLLITGFASRESVEEAMAIGVDEYVIKPFDLPELERKVTEASERRDLRLKAESKQPVTAAHQQLLLCISDPVARDILKRASESLGYRVTYIDSLSDVLTHIRNKKIMALICQLELLNRDNATACFLRSTLLMSPGVIFVAVSSRCALGNAVTALHYGAGNIIYQPLPDLATLSNTLRKFLQKG
jgi:Response regulator containing CheY-like receiver, AAA-type ATPase, and DNA-binding domains